MRKYYRPIEHICKIRAGVLQLYKMSKNDRKKHRARDCHIDSIYSLFHSLNSDELEILSVFSFKSLYYYNRRSSKEQNSFFVVDAVIQLFVVVSFPFFFFLVVVVVVWVNCFFVFVCLLFVSSFFFFSSFFLFLFLLNTESKVKDCVNVRDARHFR